jgi:ATP-dependent exoDNAse (exonuclease V) alpha subunit
MAQCRAFNSGDQTNTEVLAGLVERVTFHNADNGFCVLRIKARGHRDLVTTVGHAPTIAAGEWITASGEWINDHTHGQQFKARFMRTSEPTSIEGIKKYLGSGMIRGIGPVYAKKMVKAFGEKVFDIIEAEPDRLREVTGIGAVRAKRITDAWAEQKIVREIMVFRHSNGVGTARAVRIGARNFRRVQHREARRSGGKNHELRRGYWVSALTSPSSNPTFVSTLFNQANIQRRASHGNVRQKRAATLRRNQGKADTAAFWFRTKGGDRQY